MGLFRISWINGGSAFSVDSKSASLAAQRQVFVEKAAILKERMQGTAGLPDVVVRELMKDAEVEAFVAMMDILIHDVLAQVDPKVRVMTPAQVRDQLTSDEYIELSKALSEGRKSDKAPVADPTISAKP